jgi:hypothetical protein
LRALDHLGERVTRLSLLAYGVGMAALLAWSGVVKLLLYALGVLAGLSLVLFILKVALVPLAIRVGSLLGPLPRRCRRRSPTDGGVFPAGLCPACGYDLRATPERCPECGSVSWRERSSPGGA